MNLLLAAAVAVAAITLTLIGTAWLQRQLMARGFVDIPNERSMHTTPRVRGAGIAMAGAWALTLAVGLTVAGDWHDMAIPVGFALTLSALGLADDRISLSPWLRLLVQVIACALAVALGLGGTHLLLWKGASLNLGVLALPLFAVFLVVVVNAFNFMDGIDGLAAGQTLLAACVLIVATISLNGPLLLAATALAGVSAAFLVFNWSPARCFMGDAGSYFCGAALGAMWLSAQQHGNPLLLTVSAAAPFLLDAIVTVVIRARRGSAVWKPHRDHLYQRLVAGGNSHRRVTTLYLIGGAVTWALTWALVSLTRG